MSEVVDCVPCEHCGGFGKLSLAPMPPALIEGEKTRRCNSCRQLFPTERWGGHNVTREEWYCSPGCYVEMTGDTLPWDAKRPVRIPVVYIGLW